MRWRLTVCVRPRPGVKEACDHRAYDWHAFEQGLKGRGEHLSEQWPPRTESCPQAVAHGASGDRSLGRSWVKSCFRARSSAGEHSLHTRGVAGSIPAAPTQEPAGNSRVHAKEKTRRNGSFCCWVRIWSDTGSAPVRLVLTAEFPSGAPRAEKIRAFTVNCDPNEFRDR
jgi:hypothetical protein